MLSFLRILVVSLLLVVGSLLPTVLAIRAGERSDDTDTHTADGRRGGRSSSVVGSSCSRSGDRAEDLPFGVWYPLTELTAAAAESDDAFVSLMGPLLQAMSLSYTATSGGYYHPATVNATIEGFSKSPIVSDPSCGMRALTFVEEPTAIYSASAGKQALPPKILIVFRGTDLSDSVPSSTCDACADTIIFDNVTSMAGLGSECQQFTWEQLDYYTQAVAYVRAVMLAYPGSSIRFTGHSLGSALATMVSLKLALCNYLPPPPMASSAGSSPALVEEGARDDEERALATPPPPVPSASSAVNAGVVGVGTVGVIYPALQRLTGTLSPATYDPSSIVLFDQYYDVYYNMSGANALYGTLCVWGGPNDPNPYYHNATDKNATINVPAECVECFAQGVSMDKAVCGECMGRVHILKQYIDIVMGNSAATPSPIPRLRPACFPATPEPACLVATCEGDLSKCLGA